MWPIRLLAGRMFSLSSLYKTNRSPASYFQACLCKQDLYQGIGTGERLEATLTGSQREIARRQVVDTLQACQCPTVRIFQAQAAQMLTEQRSNLLGTQIVEAHLQVETT